MTRFTPHGSPHSLPTYKGAPFAFRYVSLPRGMRETPEFRALSRWGQVPVPVDNGRAHVRSAAIVAHLAESLGRFEGSDPAARQAIREWLCRDAGALFPSIFNGCAVQLAQRNRLPPVIEPDIAAHHRRRAAAALPVLNANLVGRDWLCAAEPADRPSVRLRRCRVRRALSGRFRALARHRRLDGSGRVTGQPQNPVRSAGNARPRAMPTSLTQPGRAAKQSAGKPAHANPFRPNWSDP